MLAVLSFLENYNYKLINKYVSFIYQYLKCVFKLIKHQIDCLLSYVVLSIEEQNVDINDGSINIE